MTNQNGEDFSQRLSASGEPREQRATGERFSTAASDVWEQTKQTAGTARERTEFFLRENPVPTILGALAVGLAIGLAIRYSASTSEKEVRAKTPLGNVDLSVLTLPFLWPFIKSLRGRAEDMADVAKDSVDRLKKVDVEGYVKPLRKKWRAWTN